eukprot:2944281-Amphidinium_carterae.1
MDGCSGEMAFGNGPWTQIGTNTCSSSGVCPYAQIPCTPLLQTCCATVHCDEAKWRGFGDSSVWAWPNGSGARFLTRFWYGSHIWKCTICDAVDRRAEQERRAEIRARTEGWKAWAIEACKTGAASAHKWSKLGNVLYNDPIYEGTPCVDALGLQAVRARWFDIWDRLECVSTPLCQNSENFPPRPLSVDLLRSTLANMEPNKAPGCDGWHSRTLQIQTHICFSYFFKMWAGSGGPT